MSTSGSSALSRCHSIADVRALARRRLPAPVFEFLEGGADDELTVRRNTEAFEHYELVPHVLVDVAKIDTSTRLLGQQIASPLIVAPTGGSRLFHHEAECAVARAAARAGTIYSLAMFATTSIEEVFRISSGPKMFQLYPTRDPKLNSELLERCRAAGYTALCITVDCPVSGNRERDRHNGLDTRPRRLPPKALLSVLTHPRWLWHFSRNPRLAPACLEGRGTGALYALNPTLTWSEVASLIREWQGPCAIKGILSIEDARHAADIGATAIVVSNHGGRQLDGATTPLGVLAEIVAAVGDRVEVILDGGVRRGTHVLKALALGAKACSIGRPYLYGLAAGGEAGVDRVLRILNGEIARGMALLGCPEIRALDRRYVRSCTAAPIQV